MTALNFPLGADLKNCLCQYILKNFHHLSPNFSSILIITPSKKTAFLLKKEFALQGVIIPKIISLSEINEEFSLLNLKLQSKEIFTKKIISPFEKKILLYKIAKKYLQNFSDSAIFSYIQDFEKLEKSIILNKTNLAESLAKCEGFAADMSQNLQNSLISFLKIFNDWQNFKNENNLMTNFELDACLLNEIEKADFTEFSAVFCVYFHGESKLHRGLLRKIASLKNGFSILTGAFEEGDFALGTRLANFVASEIGNVINFQTSTKNQNFFHFNFENNHLQALHILLHVKHILSVEKSPKIGIVCHDFKSGFLISSLLKKENIPLSTIFTESILENPFFILFIAFLKQNSLSNYLFVIKSELTIFEKKQALNFESEIRNQNLNYKKPFEIKFSKFPRNFNDFITSTMLDFRQILTENAVLSEEHLEFANFLSDVNKSVKEDLEGEPSLHISLLESFAGTVRIVKKSEGISLLSPLDARGETFQFLFITDTSDGKLKAKSSENKILNLYLQELLEIEENHYFDAWFEFASLLKSSENVYTCFSATNFEEGVKAEISPFLLHAFCCFEFKDFEFEFTTKKTHQNEEIKPQFKLDLMPKSLSATAIEKLVVNPVDFYFRYILKLNQEDEISEEISNKNMGTLLHSAIFQFHENTTSIENYIKNQLLKRGLEVDYYLNENAFRKIESWFKEERQERQENPKFVIMEKRLEWKIEVKGKEFLLNATPDRIEFYEDEVRIIDYKFYSKEISKTSVSIGLRPQLPILGFLISKLYPDFKGKINLYYYFLNLKDEKDSVEIKDVSIENYEIVETSIIHLLSNLKYFNYRELEGSFFKHLLRKV